MRRKIHRRFCKPQQMSGVYFEFNRKTPGAVKKQSSERIRPLFQKDDRLWVEN